MLLDETCVKDLIELSKAPDFPCELDFEKAEIYCGLDKSIRTFGKYNNAHRLVSVVTVTFIRVFPSKDSPNGKIAHISGAYTLPEYRGKGIMTKMLDMIIHIAKKHGADYLCCDSIADDLYYKCGFIKPSHNETRLWKPL